MTANITLHDEGDGVSVIVEEAPGDNRWVYVFPTREDACWYLEAASLLPPSIVDMFRTADLSEMKKCVGYVRDPKVTLMHFNRSSKTAWH